MDAKRFEKLKAEAQRLDQEWLAALAVVRAADIEAERLEEAARQAKRAVRDYAEECAGLSLAYL